LGYVIILAIVLYAIEEGYLVFMVAYTIFNLEHAFIVLSERCG